MKKLLSIMAGVVMVLVGGVALAACGSNTNNYIVAKTEAVTLGGQQFSNTDDFKLEYKGENKYEAKGTAAVMTADQATAFWSGVAQADDKYVVVSIKFNVGANIVFGFEQDGADFTNPDGTKVKTFTNDTETNDTLDIVLRLTTNNNTFKVVATEKDATAVTYTIDMSAVNPATV